MRLFRILLASTVGALVAACAGASSGAPTVQHPALRPAHVSPGSRGHIYVGYASTIYRGGAEVLVYNPGQNRSIGHPYDAIGELDGIAFDSAGYIYVCNFNRPAFGKNAGSVYAADPNPRTVHNDIDNPYAIALDPSDRLYVANTYGTKLDNTVAVFEPHSNVLFELLSTGISDPVSLVVDSAGNLYVANFGASDVTVYAPGSTSPSYTISDGIGAPRALTLDQNGNLYVANASLNDVTIYAPGTQTPLRTISKQVNAPDALAIDPLGKLYVANWMTYGGTITVYDLATGQLLHKITNAIYEPYSIAVDQNGRLYVANFFRSVVIFSGDTWKVLRKIREYGQGAVVVTYGP